LSVALSISLEVSQVTNMAVGVRGRAVIFVVWVDYLQLHQFSSHLDKKASLQ
jgi:hypothetical protein